MPRILSRSSLSSNSLSRRRSLGSFNNSVASNAGRHSASRSGLLTTNNSTTSKPSSQSSLWAFFGVGNDSSSGVATPATEASADYQSNPHSPRPLDGDPIVSASNSTKGNGRSSSSKKPTMPKSYVQQLNPLMQEDETDQDEWGHYVDVLEAEEKIVRASKILSRRSIAR